MLAVIDALELAPYRLPLQRDWKSARGGLAERSGWLVRARSGGLCGYGDCAPLPQAGTEDLARAASALEEARRRVIGSPAATAIDRIETARAPAARYALECTFLDLIAKQQGTPLRYLLDIKAQDSVSVNAVLGSLGNTTPKRVEQGCQAGFRVLKLKVGLSDPEVELRRLAELARVLTPGAALRLDANGAWSPSQAVRFIEGLRQHPIESLEEPLRDPSVETLAELQASAPFPLALDENLHLIQEGLWNEALPVQRVVLKPAVVGGLKKTLDLARQAAALGSQVVITSLIESAAGIWPTLQLAAATASPCAHGLATSQWLAADLGPAPVIRAGRIAPGQRPGSGFLPHPESFP